jgi:3-oxoacyl-[acyl-carrier-protein] synthase II
MGIYNPIGNTLDDVWDALITGRSGTGEITRFDPSDVESRIAGEVKDFDTKDHLGSKEARRTDRYVQLAVAAANDAIKQSCLQVTSQNAGRVGVLIGTAMGGMETIERELNTLQTRGPGRVSPFFVPMFLADMASGYVSIVLGAKGPNLSTLSACASAAHAIGESM